MQYNWLDNSVTQLSDGFPEKMVLLDCETTGGNATRHRIIEIGLLIVEHGVLLETWQTFCDPETSLPPMIQRITGIEPSMLVGAPTFSEIAERLVDLIGERTLVAHNARFDYGFIKNEFKRSGIRFNAKTLCSVKFSRILYPQFRRHGLSEIIKRFDLEIENRHRALDDAQMIYQFFRKSSALFGAEEISSVCRTLLQKPAMPPLLRASDIEKLPASPGVYYFYNEAGELLYVGKSVHIRNRVLSHFSQDHSNPKDLQMNAKISAVDYYRTPSDFGAQLFESHQIKALSPLYNRRLRKVKRLFQFQKIEDHRGYHRLQIEVVDSQSADASSGLFRSPRQATLKLEKLADEHLLCHKLLGLEGASGRLNTRPCFRAQLGKCLGACQGNESAEVYNQRLGEALADYQLAIWPWQSAILVEERDSSDPDLSTFHLIDRWRYLAKLSDMDELYHAGYHPMPVDGGSQPSWQQIEANTALNGAAVEKSHLAVDTNEDLAQQPSFDLDTYFILVRFLLDARRLQLNHLLVWPLRALPPENR